MALIVDPRVWALFPGMRLLVVTGNSLRNTTSPAGLGEEFEAAQRNLRQTWAYPNAQSHPHVAAWRAAMKAVGAPAKKFPSSIEALCRRVLAGKGLARINPLVDFYNATSLKFVVPMGAWDLDQLAHGDLHLRISEGGENFIPLGGAGSALTDSGEVVYADAEDIITRHFVWRQAAKAIITSETKRFFVVSELLGDLGTSVDSALQAHVNHELGKHFDVSSRSSIVSAPLDRWEFDNPT